MAISEAGRDELFGRIMTRDMGLTADETIGGLALVVLGILALARVDLWLLNSVATIVAGAALVFVSMTAATEFSKAMSTYSGFSTTDENSSGIGAGTLAGIAGVILGILAILDIARPTLVSVSLIVFGAAIFLDFIIIAQTRALRMMSPTATTATSEQSRMAFTAAASTDLASLLFAVALVVLGILAITGLVSGILDAVAFLAFGGFLFLKGTAGATRMLSWRTA